MKTFTAIITKDENMYVAKCPEVGTVSQGKTIEEAVKNLLDFIQGKYILVRL